MRRNGPISPTLPTASVANKNRPTTTVAAYAGVRRGLGDDRSHHRGKPDRACTDHRNARSRSHTTCIEDGARPRLDAAAERLRLALEAAGNPPCEQEIWNEMAKPGAPGEHILLLGHVYDGNGHLIRDAFLGFWQADHEGGCRHQRIGGPV